MSADRLREAARVLRERAEDAETPGPWQQIEDEWESRTPSFTVYGGKGLNADVTGGYLPPGDAAYIATIHPGVGLALAEWLEAIAPVYSSAATMPGERSAADRIADLILGSAS